MIILVFLIFHLFEFNDKLVFDYLQVDNKVD